MTQFDSYNRMIDEMSAKLHRELACAEHQARCRVSHYAPPQHKKHGARIVVVRLTDSKTAAGWVDFPSLSNLEL